MSTPGEAKLTPEEYERRRIFLESLKGLTKAEYVEIVRILQKYEAPFSENHNGIFLNLSTMEQGVFEELEKFLIFTQTNRQKLSDRDSLLSTLLVQQGSDT
jgi:hypothetical protein